MTAMAATNSTSLWWRPAVGHAPHTEEATGAEEPLEPYGFNERNCWLSSKTWPGGERAAHGNGFRCVHEPVQNPRTECAKFPPPPHPPARRPAAPRRWAAISPCSGGASGSANLADGLVRVVLPLIAVELTRSPALVAGIAVTTTLAWLVVGLPAGALGDRLDRRIIALTIAVLRTVLLGTVALL